MTKQRTRVKKRNLIARDLLTSGLFRSKKETSKTKYKRKQKHRNDDV